MGGAYHPTSSSGIDKSNDSSELLSKTTVEIAMIRDSQTESAEDVSELVDLVGKLDIKLQGWTLLQQQQVAKLHQVQKGTLFRLMSSRAPKLTHLQIRRSNCYSTGSLHLQILLSTTTAPSRNGSLKQGTGSWNQTSTLTG
jgi:hypothetical protein